MIKMKITMENDLLQQVVSRLSVLNGQTMPATAEAMKDSAALVRETWQGYVTGSRTLPGVESLKNPQGGLARSIRVLKISNFDYQIISNSEIMGYLIDGTDEVDMKEKNTKGPRSRIGERKIKGQKETEKVPYVIIPFRWGTPGTVTFRNVMPSDMYAQVKRKKFEKSVVTGETHDEPNALGKQVARQEYSWGSRADMPDSNMDGMVKMEGQGGKSAGYFTFRVISSKKPLDWDNKPHKKSWEESWVKPATIGKPITQGVVNATQEDINEILDAAFRRDLGL